MSEIRSAPCEPAAELSDAASGLPCKEKETPAPSFCASVYEHEHLEFRLPRYYLICCRFCQRPSGCGPWSIVDSALAGVAGHVLWLRWHTDDHAHGRCRRSGRRRRVQRRSGDGRAGDHGGGQTCARWLTHSPARMRMRTLRGRRHRACRRCVEHRLRLAKSGSCHQDNAHVSAPTPCRLSALLRRTSGPVSKSGLSHVLTPFTSHMKMTPEVAPSGVISTGSGDRTRTCNLWVMS
jgi:hypothetical protein